ncbi:MAG: DUF3606 domain-containing protein [Sphaerochaeta sp.]
MPDDRTKKKIPHDKSRINLSQSWEIDYWTKALGVTEAELRELVKKHGTSVAAIRTALKK